MPDTRYYTVKGPGGKRLVARIVRPASNPGHNVYITALGFSFVARATDHVAYGTPKVVHRTPSHATRVRGPWNDFNQGVSISGAYNSIYTT